MHFLRTINKTKTTTYHQWLEITILPSLIGLPVISIPHNTGSCKKALSTQFISAKNEDDRLLQFALNLFNATQKKI